MPECECLAGCAFFNEKLEEMPAMTSMIKRQYCRGDHADNTYCARHMIFVVRGREAVPLDLYPADIPRAKEILAE